MFLKKATLPLIMVFGIGLLGFAQDLVPHPIAAKFREEMTMWFRIIGGFAMFIGAYSLLHMHVTRIRRHVAGWGYSVFVFIGAAVMIILGLWNDGMGPLMDAKVENTWFDWGYKYIQIPCSATIFSILAFFMASAAFRTFRARNLAAALLLAAAVIVMFGRVPISGVVSQWLFANPYQGLRLGMVLSILAFLVALATFRMFRADGRTNLVWPLVIAAACFVMFWLISIPIKQSAWQWLADVNMFSTAADAIMDYPNLAAKRGIMLGIALGGLAQSLRILLGIERSYLGGGD